MNQVKYIFTVKYKNKDSSLPVAYDYFANISAYTKEIDPTKRLVTLVQAVDFTGQTCAEFFDVVCVNRYYSWYTDPGKNQG
jgi:beta-glucuronidase